MIHRVFSSLASFKQLEFSAGLNVLIAKKELGATEKQTRNRAGKTSLVEIIHFLAGADANRESLFRTAALNDASFGITLDLGGSRATAHRSGAASSKVSLDGVDGVDQLSNAEWVELLGEEMFGLNKPQENAGRAPTFRSLFSYFVRRQNSGAFTTPEKQATMQQPVDFQVALLFLLGLDWQVASEWQKVRDRERTLTVLRKAASDGVFGSVIGRAADLRTAVAVAEAGLGAMRTQLADFRVLPQYAKFESEADDLTKGINDLSNANVIDVGAIRDLEAAMRSEAPPQIGELESMYAQAGVSLPGLAIRRYEEVQFFHESVIRNRRDYLAGELSAARNRLAAREEKKRGLDERRAGVMNVLKSYGALEQFSKLQAEASRKEAAVESLRQRFSAAEQLEGTKNELEIERNSLALRLRRDFTERRDQLSEAIMAFEETSRKLYESAGSMIVNETSNGPQFQFPMQGSRSKGIKNMQIFCFDMMLMQLCSRRATGPGFLVHDSHLFDGVDGRQVISAMKVGAEMASTLGFQYIVTMNEDDAYKETTEGFNVRDHVLAVELTDATEDGGLFGFRF